MEIPYSHSVPIGFLVIFALLFVLILAIYLYPILSGFSQSKGCAMAYALIIFPIFPVVFYDVIMSPPEVPEPTPAQVAQTYENTNLIYKNPDGTWDTEVDDELTVCRFRAKDKKVTDKGLLRETGTYTIDLVCQKKPLKKE